MRRLAALGVFAFAAAAAVAFPGPSAAATPNLVANPGFENARYSDHSVVWAWSCESGTSQLGSPRSGQRSLIGTPTTNTTARCAQSVPVQPGQSYTLSAWVKGGYAFLGHDYGVIWAPPTSSWTRITTTFTPSSSLVQIYLHGWYQGDAFEADDVVLAGPESGLRSPVAPTDLVPQETTSHSLKLRWIDSPGATGYRIYQNGLFLRQVGEPIATVDGLTPATAYTYRVTAVNRAGESALSNVVEANTAQRYDQVPQQVRSVATTPQATTVWLAWEPVMTATDGYRVYQNGVLVGWSYGPAFTVTGLQPATMYSFEITGLNSAGESVMSRPVRVSTTPA
jgi:Fibronectin type III domain/Carbohydrate binding domain